ncbi:MAG TPA: molybdenum cofactor biosynthesis protein MoaE, partial [Candidatus Bathyarchaeia archaeon]
MVELIRIQREDFDVGGLHRSLKTRGSGCVVTFVGTVRDASAGRPISRMSVEVYEGMARAQLEAIVGEVEERYGVDRIEVVHRYGDLEVSDNIVFIGVSAGHRDEGFEACRYIIDELKKRVPI